MHQHCIAPSCGAEAELGAVFCVEHLQASTGKRGGWISAERRRRMRGASMETPLDASNIVRRLWVGSRPPFDRHLPEFDVLVLCAQEAQPEHVGFQGRTIRVPLPDAVLDRRQLNLAILGAREVAKALTDGRRVLVTCLMGVNRSAFVAGMGLALCTSLSADQIIHLMRAKRSPSCLSNQFFVEVMRKYFKGGRR